VSTLAASQSSASMLRAGGAVPSEEVRKAEEFLKRRMGLRMTANANQIAEEAQAQVQTAARTYAYPHARTH
jgi:hypothetical protein